MPSVLDIPVSGYKSCLEVSPKSVNLLKFLTSNKYKGKVEYIRSIENKKERDEEKKLLPAITPSGTFAYRGVEGLIQHSGLIQFDIDFHDNQHIANYVSIKEQISNVRNVAYCGLSVSGKGYWGLIPIAYPERHKEHYLAIEKAFKGIGINIDKKCKDISRLRVYSYDPEAYFNHQAKVLFNYHQSTTKVRKSNNSITCYGSTIEDWINELERNRIDITSGYEAWFGIGCGLANEFGESGRSYYHRVSQFNADYNKADTDKQFDECLKNKGRYNYTLGTFYYYCSLLNIKLQKA